MQSDAMRAGNIVRVVPEERTKAVSRDAHVYFGLRINCDVRLVLSHALVQLELLTAAFRPVKPWVDTGSRRSKAYLPYDMIRPARELHPGRCAPTHPVSVSDFGSGTLIFHVQVVDVSQAHESLFAAAAVDIPVLAQTRVNAL